MNPSAGRNNPHGPAQARHPRRGWSLIGIPDHQGVMNVGGRVGAALGPAAFRKVLATLGGRDGVRESLDDRGDVPDLDVDIRENHRRAALLIAEAHRERGLSVVIGGGHDHAYSHLSGLTLALDGGRLGCINIDAHLDVRGVEPAITSGSGFHLALEAGILDGDRLIEFGIQAHCNREELWRYAEGRQVTITPFEELRGGRAVMRFADALDSLSASCDRIAISLDLDAIAMAFAPGVSAPQAEGFTPSEIIEMMELAGKSSKAGSLGIFELNPLHDTDNRTARLAATAAYHFVAHALRGKPDAWWSGN